MTTKEKANDLIDKFLDVEWDSLDEEGGGCFLVRHEAKQCALICVDEIIKSSLSYDYNMAISANNYWQEVKQEIEKL